MTGWHGFGLASNEIEERSARRRRAKLRFALSPLLVAAACFLILLGVVVLAAALTR